MSISSASSTQANPSNSNISVRIFSPGDAAKQVAIMEMGWTTDSRPNSPYAWHSVTPEQQAEYLVKAMKQWVRGWMKRGWKRKGGPVENVDLWQQLVEAEQRHEVVWRWVRGHAGHPQNEYANHLATRAAKNQTGSDGLVESRFLEWLEEQRERGRYLDRLGDRSYFQLRVDRYRAAGGDDDVTAHGGLEALLLHAELVRADGERRNREVTGGGGLGGLRDVGQRMSGYHARAGYRGARRVRNGPIDDAAVGLGKSQRCQTKTNQQPENQSHLPPLSSSSSGPNCTTEPAELQ